MVLFSVCSFLSGGRGDEMELWAPSVCDFHSFFGVRGAQRWGWGNGSLQRWPWQVPLLSCLSQPSPSLVQKSMGPLGQVGLKNKRQSWLDTCPDLPWTQRLAGAKNFMLFSPIHESNAPDWGWCRSPTSNKAGAPTCRGYSVHPWEPSSGTSGSLGTVLGDRPHSTWLI